MKTKPFNINRVAEIKLSYNTKVKAADRPIITDSQSAYELLQLTWDVNKIEMQEQFVVLLLNRSNRVLGRVLLSAGTTDSNIVDSKHLFAAAISACASSIVLAHNHPSGNISPSESDKRLTYSLLKIADFLGITLIDHIIITPHDGYFSFADNVLLDLDNDHEEAND